MPGPGADRMPCGDRLLGRDALVLAVIRVGRDDDHADLVHTSCQRPVETALVHDQPDVRDVLAVWERCDQRLRIGHLRNALRMHETGHLEASNTGIDSKFDELRFARRGQNFGLALQPVARTDLDDRDLACAHRLIPRS